jgi:hypothetical protein
LRDSFGNNVTYDESLHRFAILLRYRIKVPTFGKSLSQGIVHPFKDSLVLASYRTFVVRSERESSHDAFGQWQQLIISSAEAGSLIATYFSTSDNVLRVNFTTMRSAAFDYNSNFVVRISGFFTRDSPNWKYVKLTLPANSVLKHTTTVLGLQLDSDIASNSSHSSVVTFDIDSLETGCLGDILVILKFHPNVCF